MNLFADEGVDRPVVERLRQDDHDVMYVAELAPSIPDEEVLREANGRSAVLVTADKDFGELVFRQGAMHSGVVLLRLAGLDERDQGRDRRRGLPGPCGGTYGRVHCHLAWSGSYPASAMTLSEGPVRVTLRPAIAPLTTIVNLLLLAAPLVAQAQPAAPPPGRLWRVGILFQSSPPRGARGGPYWEAILQGFRDLGYVEGRDLTFEVRYADGDVTRLAHLAQELVRLPVDVIMTPGTGIPAAMAATTTIPIVMLTSSDPVGKGQVQSVARPGGNVTGMTIAFDRVLVPKRLQLLKEAAPKVSRVGHLTTSSALRPPGEPDIHETVLVAARELALNVVFVPLDAAAQLDTALATITRERADALLLDSTGPHNMLNGCV